MLVPNFQRHWHIYLHVEKYANEAEESLKLFPRLFQSFVSFQFYFRICDGLQRLVAVLGHTDSH